MKILVTGGAGYIGSFMVKRLLEEKYEVIVLDSLEKGYPESIPAGVELVQGSLLDKEFLSNLFSQHTFSAIIHFAAYISMKESMEDPYKYFENNTYGALNIIEVARKNSVKKFVFSSTAGVYGNPEEVPIPENHPKNPTNSYGESKLMTERILEWYQTIFGFNYVVLRYFNASGAALDGSMGEKHDPETHIIPNAIQAALEKREFTLFGDDYNTPDGSCVRDYIHVIDLVEAHVLALQMLEKSKGGYTYNVGTGQGYSNKEIVEMVKKVSGRDLQVKNEARRPGDSDTLVADVTKIKNELHFLPKFSDLETIIASAWKWHSRNE
jgi:UDP-glucose 4-epimerase